MRYYGGGIGHLNNTPPKQADPLDSSSDEMDMEEGEGEDTGSDVGDGPQDVVMKDGELEVNETDEEDGSRDGDRDGDDNDNYDYDESDEGGEEDEDEGEGSTCSSDNDDDSCGYASP